MTLGNRLLLIVSERIGDAIFCTPAIALLKQLLPTATLAILAPSKASGDLFAHNPAIHHIYVAPSNDRLQELAQLYDTVIDFHNNKITRQYSHSLNLPTYYSPRTKTNQHQSLVASEFIASLLSCALPGPSSYLLYPQAKDLTNTQQLLLTHGIDLTHDILIGCHVGCSQIARRGWKLWKKTSGHKSWPIKNFAQLEQKLQRDNHRIRFILTGTHSEVRLCQQLAAHSKHIIDLSGKTNVLELTALMNYFHLFLTGDTGPLHIACTTTKPIIALFGPTSPNETGPYPQKPWHRIIHQSDIATISVDTVYHAIKETLAI